MHQDSISHDIWILWKCFNGLKNTFVYQIKKFVPSFFKGYPNRFLYHHTFLRKTLWKLYDPFITFRLQMWRMNYLHISKSFSVCLWNIFENITGMPLRGHLLAARSVISTPVFFFQLWLFPSRGIKKLSEKSAPAAGFWRN